MKLFALDTATEACSVALWLDGETVERFEVAGRDHTQRLPAMAKALMAEAGLRWSQLDGLVCGTGPGSFAGVRIGVAYTQGLALAQSGRANNPTELLPTELLRLPHLSLASSMTSAAPQP